MKKVAVIGCSVYIDKGHGCPGDWRCFKAAANGDGKFEEPSQVVSFIRCECPGRSLVSTTGMSMKMSEIKPDKIYLSSCMVNAKPGCPYFNADEIAEMISNNFGIEVVKGTHDYH